MLAIKLATYASNFAKRFLEVTFLILLDCKSSFLQLLCLQLFKTNLARFFFLVSLGGNDYLWGIFGMDLITGLYGPEFHFTSIIDSCLPSEVAHFCSCHKKSTLTKQ
jgi:hypothetical protein